ncbi:hypothetical protein B7R54_18380 [Subtercola boreus]|uniref:ABC transporter n=1 Tax=Subtercola boreus TaxID=120213 RepID=A0A3E0VM35_9MICO|nr:DUF2975 domain-containing protein [Subtercola boreus]RFA10956.1 hypothetical protein B7R54_18380 [Subtercola boreus]TQL55447.1 DUF2975 family protein [Subtercola boreus]
MSRSSLLTLRVLLVLLFAGALAAQVTSVALASETLEGLPAGVLAALIIAGAVAVEVVLLSAWMLVALVPGDAIFDDQGRTDPWVRIAVGALVVGAALGAAGFVFFAALQGVAPISAGPSLLVLCGAAAGVGAALALLVGVMRRLLHTAIRLQSELAEVI